RRRVDEPESGRRLGINRAAWTFLGHRAGQSVVDVSIRYQLRATAVHRVVVGVLVGDIEAVVTDVRSTAVGQVITGPPVVVDQILPRIGTVCFRDVEVVAHRAQPEVAI